MVVAKSTELKRLSADVSSTAHAFPEKSVLRRWSIVSDVAFDFTMENKKSDSGSNEEERKGELWFQILQCGTIIMFPYRRSRSRSAHIAGGIDIKSDERHSKGRKKELFPEDEKQALFSKTSFYRA
ncbi:hypothetical protein ISN44_As13g015000 [Arabidopsis suecica]|uniref:Uncharacterized protein n=1 Tax=Arabidopsis suecica TaxID=45249 RepID=A0A8T1XU49_ARASU|nr:hypothetical protein ISN44_As13g015000 [Arabidopsis suecica]